MPGLKVRFDGNDQKLIDLAKGNAMKVTRGSIIPILTVFIIHLGLCVFVITSTRNFMMMQNGNMINILPTTALSMIIAIIFTYAPTDDAGSMSRSELDIPLLCFWTAGSL